jgi:D-alanine-D-alanine ligase
VDIVFNICEGIEGRDRESEVPVVLGAKGIPFVGSDGLAMGLSLDKVLTKKVLIAEGIPTPKFIEVDNLKQASKLKIGRLKFPLIVKPRMEGSSKGISQKSLVKNMDELRERCEYVIKTYKQPALVEEFISGYEFTVAIIGNENPEVFAPVQTKINGRLKPDDFFYSFERLKQFENTIEYIFPPLVDEELQKKVMSTAKRVYEAIDCRDFGRVDIRVDDKGTPYVLEINPLPCLAVEDVFGVIAPKIGITFAEMTGRILSAALKRYNIKP